MPLSLIFCKRPFRLRVVFLIAAGLLMLFVFLLVFKGFNSVNGVGVTMSESLTVSIDIFCHAALKYVPAIVLVLH
jgi:hypothetical protein